MIDKNEIKRKYKEFKPTIGVYKIENKATGKFFIGSNLNIEARFNRYKMEATWGLEQNIDFFNDLKKYGYDGFTFTIIDKIKPKDDPNYNYRKELLELEEMWLNELQPYGERGYNIKK